MYEAKITYDNGYHTIRQCEDETPMAFRKRIAKCIVKDCRITGVSFTEVD